MNPYYAKFYEFIEEYSKGHRFNGVLTDEDSAERAAEITDYVEKAHPYTREIHKALPTEKRHRVGMWGTECGLNVSTRSDLRTQWGLIQSRWAEVARLRCLKLREKADWTGKNFLTDPRGHTANAMNMPYGPYTVPSEAYDRGMWNYSKDGTLEEVEFTV